MGTVTALYRYPVKGFTPEPVTELIVQPDGRIAGDRVLAFRFADAAEPEDRDGLDYWPKARGLSLQDFPSLAALRLEYRDAEQRVLVHLDGRVLVDADLSPDGRRELEEAMTAYLADSAEAGRLARPGRLPLVLVGDGVTSQFQDRPRGYVSVHSAASVDTLAATLAAEVDHRRFRSNVVIDGVPREAELSWLDPIQIGDVGFAPQGHIVRCLATHANPDSGVRDLPILTTLTQRLGQRQPTLGRLLLPLGSGGVIRVGDTVGAAGGDAA